MNTQRDGRPPRRSAGQPWLDRKYSREPADPKLAAWADRTLESLAGERRPRHIGPFRDPERARKVKNALYDSVNKRWNRTHPDDLISLSANLADPEDGKCYAREKCRCEDNECRPSPRGQIWIHARVWTKAEGRAHQGTKPRDEWDYDPLARRPATAAAPDRAFGAAARRPEPDPEPDPEPAKPNPPPKPKPKPDAKQAKPDGETLVAKVLRWTS